MLMKRRPMPCMLCWQHVVNIADVSNRGVEGDGALRGLARSALPGIDRGTGYHRLTCSAYVNAAYCVANPVSHPNPPNPPCAALDPHCWASTLGRGRQGIGATA
jgi:hypothetical protein